MPDLRKKRLWWLVSPWLIGGIVGIAASVLLYFVILTPLIFMGFFGSWLNFDQGSTLGIIEFIIEQHQFAALTLSFLGGILVIGTILSSWHRETSSHLKYMISATALAGIIALLFFLWKDWQGNISDAQIVLGEHPTIEQCSQVSNIQSRNGCYSEIAIQNYDPIICEHVVDVTGEDNIYPKDLCIAQAAKDTSHCEKLDFPLRDACYRSIAIYTGNASLCEKLSDPLGKYVCTALITKDASECEKASSLSLDAVDSCYSEVSSDLKDKSWCEKIKSRYHKNLCNLAF